MSPVHRPLAGEALHVRLDQEADQLEASEILHATGRNARTLVKEGPLRITLIAVAPGGYIATHHTQAPVSIQVLRGVLRLRVGQHLDPVELAAGELLTLGSSVEHDVSSQDGSVFLLTVAEPEPAESPLTQRAAAAAAGPSATSGRAGAAPAEQPENRSVVTATDSVGLRYMCRRGNIWVHYPTGRSEVSGPDDPGWPIGPIPAHYATNPPNAITAERVGLWRSLCRG